MPTDFPEWTNLVEPTLRKIFKDKYGQDSYDGCIDEIRMMESEPKDVDPIEAAVNRAVSDLTQNPVKDFTIDFWATPQAQKDWVHYTFVKESKDIKLFVNGELNGTVIQ